MHLSNTNDTIDNDHKYFYVIPPSTCLNHLLIQVWSIKKQHVVWQWQMPTITWYLVISLPIYGAFHLVTIPRRLFQLMAPCLIICNQSSSLSFCWGNKNLERVVDTRSTELHESWVIQTHWWRLEVHLNKLGGWRW